MGEDARRAPPRRVSARRVLVLVAIGSLGLSAAVAIVVLLFGDFGETEGRILGTTFSISVASLLALPGTVLLERQRQLLVAATNVALTLVAFVLALALLWIWEDAETLWRVLGSFLAAAVASTQWGALTLRRRPGDSDGSASPTSPLACSLPCSRRWS